MGKKKKSQKQVEEPPPEAHQDQIKEQIQSKEEVKPLKKESSKSPKEPKIQRSQQKLKKTKSQRRKSQSNIKTPDLSQLPRYSWQEVGKHDHKNDAWLVIDDTVYNVTKFKDKHPGGMEVIMDRAGKDATKTFEKAKHPIHALEQTLPSLRVGSLVASSKKQFWQKEERTGLMDLFCAVVIGVGLMGFITYLSL